jgi:hypothetical protein
MHRLSNLLLAFGLRKIGRYLFSAKMLIRSDLDWIRAFLPKLNGSGFSNPDFPTRNGSRFSNPEWTGSRACTETVPTESINYNFVLLLQPVFHAEQD